MVQQLLLDRVDRLPGTIGFCGIGGGCGGFCLAPAVAYATDSIPTTATSAATAHLLNDYAIRPPDLRVAAAAAARTGAAAAVPPA